MKNLYIFQEKMLKVKIIFTINIEEKQIFLSYTFAHRVHTYVDSHSIEHIHICVGAFSILCNCIRFGWKGLRI